MCRIMSPFVSDGAILLFGVIYSVLFTVLRATDNTLEDGLLCRRCGHEVAQAVHMNTIPSKRAQRQRNDTILGVPEVLIQLFENPERRKFEVITAEKADVYKSDQAFYQDTWFPGYAWRIAVCPKCGAHLGWSFEPHDHAEGKQDTYRTFVGLILGNLLEKNYADSLLITPKSYSS